MHMKKGDDARVKAEEFERKHKLPAGTADVLTPFIESTVATELAKQEPKEQGSDSVDDLVVAVDVGLGDGNVEITVDLHDFRAGMTTSGNKDSYIMDYGHKTAADFCAEHNIDDAVVETLAECTSHMK